MDHSTKKGLQEMGNTPPTTFSQKKVKWLFEGFPDAFKRSKSGFRLVGNLFEQNYLNKIVGEVNFNIMNFPIF